MSDEQQKNTSGIYEIKLQGHLDTKWSEWFYGMTITHEGDGTTSLCGSLPDQIVLHSVLDRIRDMNLPLLSVNQIVSGRQTINHEVKERAMKSNTSTTQKLGWVIFAVGAAYMFGLGWLYSWRVVPAANEFGSDAYSGLLGFLWALSVPLGTFIVAIGAALTSRVERQVIWLLILLIVFFTIWQIAGTTSQMIPALFGVGGGLITLFFLGSTWQWARIRPTLTGAGKTGSDLRMLGFIFFVVAAWNLCGIFGMGNYVLRPELADKFSVPISDTIDAASRVMVLLVLAWGFTFLGQLMSRQVEVVDSEVDKVPQGAAAD
jgi:hypothetical protein